jgi:acetolactate synthase-1/2/3 large subunit
MPALLDSLAAKSSSSMWEPDEVSAYRRAIRDLFSGDQDRLTIPAVIDDAAGVAPRDTVVVVDAGFGKPLMSYLWPSAAPNSYASSHGLSTMGYALPAANALKATFPDRTILGFMGDGSLHMRATEIGVAADLGLAPVYVCWVDGGLTQIEIKQRRRGLRPVGTSLPPRSSEGIADAFGGVGYDVTSREEFRAAFRESLARADRPSLIGARVDNRDRDRWFEALRG